MRRPLALSLLLSLVACDGGAGGALVGGTYDVTLYGPEVRPDGVVGSGTLVLRSTSVGVSPVSVGGTWRLQYATDDGTRVEGAGVVRGWFDGVNASLELGREEIADAGYHFGGTVEGDEIRGEWTVEYGVSEGTARFVARR